MSIVKRALAQSKCGATVLANPRGLSPTFMKALQSGLLTPILEVVKSDDTLSLNIRDEYINIYYRGGSIIRVKHPKGVGSNYAFWFDPKYTHLKRKRPSGLPTLSLAGLPPKVAHPGDVGAWVSAIPLLKLTMDLWFAGHHELEREYQQLVERANNSNSSTDYFISDIEWTNTLCGELRLDLIAVHWPSTSSARRNRDCAKLAFIEMKHLDGAMAGLAKHVKDLQKCSSMYLSLAQETTKVFNQRAELGLIECPVSKLPVLQSIDATRPEYIILLSDHDPAKSALMGQLLQIQAMSGLPFDIKVAVASFMGYGLYDPCMYTLPDFLKRFPAQVYTPRKNVAQHSKLPVVELPCPRATTDRG